ncbi:MAG: N-methyl-L-tryptophan oxidase [Bosea sp. (in: a-proteobacteria)]
MKTADVIVAGLGAMGAATLFQLARRGIRAIGIDAHAPPHAIGSSHGETRITRLAVGEGADYAPLVTASHRIWRALEAEGSAQLLNPCGCLVIGRQGGAGMHHSAGDFVETTIAAAAAAHVPIERLTTADLAARYPQLLGLNDEHGCFEPTGGFVYPERCIDAQLQEARKLGAQTITARISKISQSGTSVRVETDQGTFEASQLVAALGSWTAPLLGAPFDGLLKVTRQVLHWFDVEEPMLYAPERFPTLIWMYGATSSDCLYGFPALPGAGRIKMGSEQYDEVTTADALDRNVSEAEKYEMYQRHLGPRLKGVRPAPHASTVCHYTVTPGSRFIIDTHPAMERVMVISACSGHGFKHSAGIGEALAEQIESGRTHSMLAPFALNRLPA